MSRSDVNLDTFLQEFDECYKAVCNLKTKNSFLEQQQSLLQKENSELCNRLDNSEQEGSRLTNIICGLQTTLSATFDWQEECTKLKESLQQQQQINEELQRKMEETENTFLSNIACLKEQHLNEGQQMTDKFNCALKANKEETATLRRELSEVIKEKESEILKIKLEHSQELFKLQQHTTMTGSKQVLPTATNDREIYRKKLKHFKEESDKEISSLKRKISELQNKLDSNTPRHQTPLFNGPPSRKFKNF